MRVLIVGGAGYIGSHMVKMLDSVGVELIILDNLSSGYREAVLAGKLIIGDIADHTLLLNLFSQYKFDAVMHFASYIEVGESVINPAKFYKNNVENTRQLLDVMLAFGVKNFIFSSTAAVFGQPMTDKISEIHSKKPINPYGRSKLFVEEILADYEQAYGLRHVILRYFNAAGANPEGLLGERHNPETHLIPLVLQVASGRRESISIFGTDYPTPDGSCIRDYIHVDDLCFAHLQALKKLFYGMPSNAFNLGNGDGFSVYQVIQEAQNVTGETIKSCDCPPRIGDPAVLVADSTFAFEQLDWRPRYNNLQAIIAHAWQWEKKLADI